MVPEFQGLFYFCILMTRSNSNPDSFPLTLKELKSKGWECADVILVTGDAFVDHPSFGTAVIARVLESIGVKVAVISQPNWRDDLRDFRKFGKPNMFFGVSSGNMDSMINHYTANKRLRSDDAYTPEGRFGSRPDYATVVYTKILKTIFPDVPVILGGIEASLRRLTHYDYWSDTLKPGILHDSGADMLVYGMGERSVVEIVNNLRSGKPVLEQRNVPQTAFISETQFVESIPRLLRLHSFEQCKDDKLKFAENFKIIEIESNKLNAETLAEKCAGRYTVVNPPYPVMTAAELDKVYSLPFTRRPHSKYSKVIPAYEMIKNSVSIMRGCFGGCSFCTISAHQGKFVSSRSEKSVLNELETIAAMSDFKGHISDLGGPTANMWNMQGFNLSICEKCKRPSCIFPSICNNLNTDHTSLTELYNKSRNIAGIKKITIGSGLRYDIIFDPRFARQNAEYLRNLVLHHVSGRLKVAPEHTSDSVLEIMRKPSFSLFHRLCSEFNKIDARYSLNQQIIPYFISSHPGSTNIDMACLAAETKSLNFHLEQVQDFTPTPMTHASVIYYTGVDPYSKKKIFTAKTKDEKLGQRKYFFWYKKEYREKIAAEMRQLKRLDISKKLFGK